MGPSNSINTNMFHLSNELPRTNNSLTNSTDSKTNQMANHTIQQSNTNQPINDASKDLNNNNNNMTTPSSIKKKPHPQANKFNNLKNSTSAYYNSIFGKKTNCQENPIVSKRKASKDLDNNNNNNKKTKNSLNTTNLEKTTPPEKPIVSKRKASEDLDDNNNKKTKTYHEEKVSYQVPEIKKKECHHWTDEEITILSEGVKKFGDRKVNWIKISELFGYKISNKKCSAKYKELQFRKDNTPWSEEEIKCLKEGFTLLGNQWNRIAKEHLNSKRSPSDCCRKMKSLDPNLTKGLWTEEETNQFLDLLPKFKDHLHLWAEISKEMEAKGYKRSPNQCEAKYISLKDACNEWKENEINSLIKGFLEFSNEREIWEKIHQKYIDLKGRTPAQLRTNYFFLNREDKWNSLIDHFQKQHATSNNNNHFHSSQLPISDEGKTAHPEKSNVSERNRDSDNSNQENPLSLKKKQTDNLIKIPKVREEYRYWTPEEERKLEEAVKQYGEDDLRFISVKVFQNKFSQRQCYLKYHSIISGSNKETCNEETKCLQEGYQNIVPQWKQGPWTDEETIQFIELIEKYENHQYRWREISKVLNRSPQQCQTKYRHLEAPNLGWTEEEIQLLIKGYREFSDQQNKCVRIHKKYLPKHTPTEISIKHFHLNKAGRLQNPSYATSQLPSNEKVQEVSNQASTFSTTNKR